MKSLIRPAKSSLSGSTIPTHWRHSRTPRTIWPYSEAQCCYYLFPYPRHPDHCVSSACRLAGSRGLRSTRYPSCSASSRPGELNSPLTIAPLISGRRSTSAFRISKPLSPDRVRRFPRCSSGSPRQTSPAGRHRRPGRNRAGAHSVPAWRCCQRRAGYPGRYLRQHIG